MFPVPVTMLTQERGTNGQQAYMWGSFGVLGLTYAESCPELG